MAPINETHITPENVSWLTNEEIKVVLKESKRRQSETATTLDHQETAPLAPKWTGKLYSDPDAPGDEQNGNQSILNREYDGNINTYAKLDGIERSFQKQGIEVKKFDTWEEATVYLKEIFRDYKDKFPELWKENNWRHTNNTSLKYQTLLWPNWALQNIPYCGYQDWDGKRVLSNKLLFIRLPLRVGSWFVCIWSDRSEQEASFDHGCEYNTKPVASFEK